MVFVGDSIDLMWVQHLAINTSVTNNISLVSASPLGAGVAPNAPIRIQIQNNSRLWIPAHLPSVSMASPFRAHRWASLNPGASAPSRAQPATNFPANATIPVQLTYQDNANPAPSNTNTYSFTTYPYVTLPASYAVSAASVNKTDGNAYYIYLYQSATALNESLALAEQEVSGLITNSADLSGSPNADGGFSWPSTRSINFSTAGLPGEFLGSDNGSGGTAFPNQNSGGYYGVEILTYLQLNPGTYTFGVDTVSNYVQGTGIPAKPASKSPRAPRLVMF